MSDKTLQKQIRTVQKRVDHFEHIMRNEIGMREDWIKFFMHRTFNKPSEAIKVLDKLSDQIEGRNRGRLKRCINGINKAWKKLPSN